MKCIKCGTEVNENIKFCPNCGSKIETEISVVDGVNDSSNVLEQSIPTNEQTTSETTTVETTNSVDSSSVNQGQVLNTTYANTYQQPINDGQIGQPMGGYQQPSNNFGQNYNQPYAMAPTSQNKNNSTIIIIVVTVLAVIICGIIIANSVSKNENNNSNKTTSNSNIVSNSNSNSYSNILSNSNSNIYSNSNYNSNSNSNSTDTNKTVTFGGYVLQIPSNYTVSSVTSQLQLIGTNNKDVAGIQIVTGDYDSIKISQETMKAYMEKSGYIVNNVQVSNYNNVEFITATVEQDGKNMILAYSKLGNDKVFVLVVMNTSFTIDYSPLYDFATMVSTAQVAS